MERRNKVEDVDDFLKEAIDNIRHDRALTKGLLTDILTYIKKSTENHKEIGNIAAKYVETLQRSNEQLVKLTSILKKKESTEQRLTQKDKDDLFDLIKEDTG